MKGLTRIERLEGLAKKADLFVAKHKRGMYLIFTYYNDYVNYRTTNDFSSYDYSCSSYAEAIRTLKKGE